MDHGTPHPPSAADRPGWNKPQPDIIPPPTYAPVFMSAGIVFLVWGLLTHWLVSVVGFGFLVVSLSGWLRAIRKDWRIK